MKRYPEMRKAKDNGIGIFCASVIEDRLLASSMSDDLRDVAYKCLERLIPEVELFCPAAIVPTKGKIATAYGPSKSIHYGEILLCMVTPKRCLLVIVTPSKQSQIPARLRNAAWGAFSDYVNGDNLEMAVEVAIRLAPGDITRSEQYLNIKQNKFTPMLVILGSKHQVDKEHYKAGGFTIMLPIPAAIEDQVNEIEYPPSPEAA